MIELVTHPNKSREQEVQKDDVRLALREHSMKGNKIWFIEWDPFDLYTNYYIIFSLPVV